MAPSMGARLRSRMGAPIAFHIVAGAGAVVPNQDWRATTHIVMAGEGGCHPICQDVMAGLDPDPHPQVCTGRTQSGRRPATHDRDRRTAGGPRARSRYYGSLRTKARSPVPWLDEGSAVMPADWQWLDQFCAMCLTRPGMRARVCADPAFIVTRGHVHHPVQPVLDTPVIADGRPHAGGGSGEGGDVKAGFLLDLFTSLARAFDHGHGLQPRPVMPKNGARRRRAAR